MEADRTEAINALLVRAEEAHGTYEAAELNGVYDQDWPQWYAAYVVENGIGALLGHDVTSDELAQILVTSNEEFERLDAESREAWAGYTSRRIAAEL